MYLHSLVETSSDPCLPNNPCQNGGICSSSSGSGGFTCSCASGYTGDDCGTAGTVYNLGFDFFSLGRLSLEVQLDRQEIFNLDLGLKLRNLVSTLNSIRNLKITFLCIFFLSSKNL